MSDCVLHHLPGLSSTKQCRGITSEERICWRVKGGLWNKCKSANCTAEESCGPDFLHFKNNRLGAKTSMQEEKKGKKVHKAGFRKCVLMLMSFCRSYVNSNLLVTVLLAPPYYWLKWNGQELQACWYFGIENNFNNFSKQKKTPSIFYSEV